MGRVIKLMDTVFTNKALPKLGSIVVAPEELVGFASKLDPYPTPSAEIYGLIDMGDARNLIAYGSSGVVLRYDTQTGGSFVLAGNGVVSGGAGQDGIGGAATFGSLFQGALDPDRKNAYFAERSGGRVRKLNLETMAVTTVVTGLPAIIGLTFGDDSNELYVVQGVENAVLKRVNLLTKSVTILPTLANRGGGQLAYSPHRRKVYAVSNNFPGLQAIHSIWSYDVDTGISEEVSTTDGFGNPMNQPFGLAIGNLGRYLYYTTFSAGGYIFRMDVDTRKSKLLAGGGGANVNTDGVGQAATATNAFGMAWNGKALYVATPGTGAMKVV